jgi:uncharacterized membrane protein
MNLSRVLFRTASSALLAGVALAQGVPPAPVPISGFQVLTQPGAANHAEVSYDGTAVFANYVAPLSGPATTYRWPVSGAPVSIGTLPTGASKMRSYTNSNGTLSVGTANDPVTTFPRSYLWTSVTGMLDITSLYTLPGGVGAVSGLTAFNEFTIGGTPGSNVGRLFHLPTGAFLPIARTTAYPNSAMSPLGVSSTGRYTVGVIDSPGQAFVFDAIANASTPLGTLPGVSPTSLAVDVSDNAIVVGTSKSNPFLCCGPSQAFFCDASTQPPGAPQGLGFLSGGFTDSFATAVSSDGRFIVGYCSGGGNAERAFIYDRLNPGMQDLAVYIASFGANLIPTGLSLRSATDINANGAAIVGLAAYPGGATQAFRTL